MVGNGFLGSNAEGVYLLADLTGRVDDMLEVDPNDANGVRLRATQANPNLPSPLVVHTGVQYGFNLEYTGTLP